MTPASTPLPVTAARFAALAEAYGGDVGRWPEDEQPAAWAHLRQHPEAEAVLLEAARLDATLAAWTVPGPGAVLAAQIAASAGRRQVLRRRWRLWLSSLGAATALAGGLAAGAGVVTLSVPSGEQTTASLYEVSVLGAPVDLDAPAAAGGGS